MANPQDHLRDYLRALGLDETVDPELRETPERFTELLRQMFAGVDAEPPRMSTFPVDSMGATDASEAAGAGEPVIMAALPFQSMCVHHLVPMFGTIDVAYVPADRMVGFGSVGRVVDHFARRPQVQERLVAEIAGYLADHLKPEGVLVRCRARQLCMELRGAKKRGILQSSASRGVLADGPLRAEVIAAFDAAE